MGFDRLVINRFVSAEHGISFYMAVGHQAGPTFLNRFPMYAEPLSRDSVQTPSGLSGEASFALAREFKAFRSEKA